MTSIMRSILLTSIVVLIYIATASASFRQSDNAVPEGYMIVGNSKPLDLTADKRYRLCRKKDDGSAGVCNEFSYYNCKLGSLFFLLLGKYTKSHCGQFSPGLFWVEQAELKDKTLSLMICNSDARLFYLYEYCVRVSETDSGGNTIGSGNVIDRPPGGYVVKKFTFDRTNAGTIRNQHNWPSDKYKLYPDDNINAAGYAYTLYNDDCPYSDADAKCAYGKTIKAGYNATNNCKLVRDDLSKTCPSGLLCPCDDTNSCDNKFMPLSPKAKGDENSALDRCYRCNANARLAYSECQYNVKNRPALVTELLKAGRNEDLEALRGMYGIGQYLCGFYINGAWPFRVGCLKIQSEVPPRPFGRIILGSEFDLLKNPSIHMFARVRAKILPWRQQNVPQDDGSCNTGQAQLGEKERGTFFRPKIFVAFGANKLEITFSIPQEKMITKSVLTNLDMTTIYGGYDFQEKTKMYSPWNTEKPIRMEYRKFIDSTCKQGPVVPNVTALICTRLEYDPIANTNVYAAYQYFDSTSTTADNRTCASMEAAKELLFIGSVTRPTLQYRYLKDKVIAMPLSIQESGTGVKSIPSSVVTLDPAAVQTQIASYHYGLNKMSVLMTPDYYDIINESKNVTNLSCKMLFMHKVCISRDPCMALNAIGSADFNSIISNQCYAPYCQKLKDTLASCSQLIHCGENEASVETCMNTNQFLRYIINRKDLEYYQRNNGFYDENCISDGINSQYIPNADQSNTEPESIQDLVFAYRSHDSGTHRMPLRFSEYDNYHRLDNLINPNNPNEGVDDVLMKRLSSAKYEASSKTLFERYLGSNCDLNCASKTLIRRYRTNKEMGLCAPNSSLSKTWANAIQSVGTVDVYMPYRCQFIEFALCGGGGGSMITASGFSHMNQGKAFRSSGSGSGHINSILNLRALDTEYIRFVVGSGAKTRIGNHWQHSCVAPCAKWYSPAYLFCAADRLGYSYAYTGSQDSSIGDINRTYAVTQRGSSNADFCYYDIKNRIPGGEPKIENNINNAIVNSSMPNFMIEGPVASTTSAPDVYGDGSFRTFASNGQFTFVDMPVTIGSYSRIGRNINNYVAPQCGGGIYIQQAPATTMDEISKGDPEPTTMITPGGDGFASIMAAKVVMTNVQGSQVPLVVNGEKTLKGAKERDPHCISACPRINVRMNVNGTTMVCEYGGIYINEKGLPASTEDNDLQPIAGSVVLPSKCVTEDGSVIFPGSYAKIAFCPSDMVSDSNRFFGLCTKKAGDKTQYIHEMVSQKSNIFSGAGIYCTGTNCNAVNRMTSINIISDLHTNRAMFARRCLDGGFWSNITGLLPGTPIKQTKSNLLQYFCPAIDVDKIGYDPKWSMNAFWPQTAAGNIAETTRCMTGYIPRSTNIPLKRTCDINGIWRGIVSSDICLYSCPKEEIKSSYIAWNTPISYDSPISTPECLSGPMRVSLQDGSSAISTVKYVFEANTRPESLQRTCVMPTIKDPYTNAHIGPNSQAKALMPYWTPVPKGAKCVPPSLLGGCNYTTNVCFESTSANSIVSGVCRQPYVYQINGIVTLPPMGKLDASLNISNPDKDFAILAISGANYSCIIDKPAIGLLKDFQCKAISRSLMLEYPNINGTKYYMQVSDKLSGNNMAALNNYDTNASSRILANINTDNAISASQCTLDTDSIDDEIIAGQMQNQNFCSQACVFGSEDRILFYDCSDIDKIPITAKCYPVCYSTNRTLSYDSAVGFSYNLTTKANAIRLQVMNSDKCVGMGIANALKRMRANKYGTVQKVSSYCKEVTFSALNLNASRAKVEISMFNQLWDVGKKSCWQPKSCKIPNTPAGTFIAHSANLWIMVADELAQGQNKIQYSSVQSDIGCQKDDKLRRYNLSTSGALLLNLYCYDGNLYRVDSGTILSYMKNDESTCNLSSVSKANHLVNLIDANSTAISNITKIPENIIRTSIIVDLNNTRVQQYLALKSLSTSFWAKDIIDA